MSDHTPPAGPPSASTCTRIEELVNHVSCAIAEVQDLLLSNANAAGRNTQGGSDPIPMGTLSQLDLAIHPGRIDLKINVKAAKNLRHLRKKMFGDELFSGPAWGILLELFESHTIQRLDTVGQVCTSADLPCSTVLRWLNRLSDKGLVRMSDDRFDGRRRFVELSEAGVELMTRYFSGAAPHVVAA